MFDDLFAGADFGLNMIPALPFPRHNDTGELEKAVGKLRWTPHEEGIARSAEVFKTL